MQNDIGVKLNMLVKIPRLLKIFSYFQIETEKYLKNYFRICLFVNKLYLLFNNK